MLNILRVVAREYGPGLEDFLARFFDPARLRGLHLHADPYWLAYRRQAPSGPGPSRPPSFLREKEGMEALDRLPPFWDVHCRSLGAPQRLRPLRFHVVFRHPEDLVETRERPAFFEDFLLRYERRPPARGLAGPSFPRDAYSIGSQAPDTTGTAGGLVHHVHRGTEYVVSCRHVLGAAGDDAYIPGPANRSITHLLRSPRRIGTVVLDRLPPPSPPQGCSKTANRFPETLDLALLELDPAEHAAVLFPHLLRPQRLTPDAQMVTRDPVFFVGDTSGQVQAEFGSYAYWHTIEIEGADRCFGDIFTLTPPHPWYLNTELAREGDSGAWVLREEDGLISWDGMLFAGDGANGYACLAQNVMDALQRFDAGLALLP